MFPHAALGKMGHISYLGETPVAMRPLERVMFMQDMGRLWRTWRTNVMPKEDYWKWGINLSHHKAADRHDILIRALCDVCNYENLVHGTEKECNGAKWQSIVQHVLEQATFVCTKEGSIVE